MQIVLILRINFIGSFRAVIVAMVFQIDVLWGKEGTLRREEGGRGTRDRVGEIDDRGG